MSRTTDRAPPVARHYTPSGDSAGRRPPGAAARLSLLVLAALGALTLSGRTLASDAAAEDTASANAQGLEEITVIARKVEESAQSVPLSVVALSGVDLKQNVVITVQDLQEHVTGLVISPNSQGSAPTFAIRASKQDNGTAGGVAVYLEDVPQPSTWGIANSIYDMQSVDVLRGPQGTLFGKNVTGGAVVFRPNKPTDTWDGYFEGEGGDYSRAYFEGMINAPVNDWLEIRAAGNLLDRDGFVTNLTPEPGIREELNNAHYRSARLTIRTLFGPVTNDIIGTYYGEDDSGPVQIGLEYLPPVQALGAKSYGPWTISLGGNASGVTLPIYQRIKVSGFEDALNWQIADGISLHNALSLNDTYADTFQNNDGTFIYMVDGRTESKYRQWIEEPTIHISLLNGKLRYTGGLWYSHNTQNDGNSYDLAQNFLYRVPANTFYPGSPASPVAQLSNSYYERNGYSRALYSQAEFDVKPDVTVTLGRRYNWDELSLLNSQHGYLA